MATVRQAARPAKPLATKASKRKSAPITRERSSQRRRVQDGRPDPHITPCEPQNVRKGPSTRRRGRPRLHESDHERLRQKRTTEKVRNRQRRRSVMVETAKLGCQAYLYFGKVESEIKKQEIEEILQGLDSDDTTIAEQAAESIEKIWRDTDRTMKRKCQHKPQAMPILDLRRPYLKDMMKLQKSTAEAKELALDHLKALIGTCKGKDEVRRANLYTSILQKANCGRETTWTQWRTAKLSKNVHIVHCTKEQFQYELATSDRLVWLPFRYKDTAVSRDKAYNIQSMLDVSPELIVQAPTGPRGQLTTTKIKGMDSRAFRRTQEKRGLAINFLDLHSPSPLPKLLDDQPAYSSGLWLQVKVAEKDARRSAVSKLSQAGDHELSSCRAFSLYECKGAFSLPHVDRAFTWTTVKCMDTKKLWPIVRPLTYQQRMEWSQTGTLPDTAIVDCVLLEEGDVLVMPPGTIHLPYSLEDVHMEGGMNWAAEDVSNILRAAIWEFRFPNTTNEDPAAKLGDKINLLFQFIKKNPKSAREKRMTCDQSEIEAFPKLLKQWKDLDTRWRQQQDKQIGSKMQKVSDQKLHMECQGTSDDQCGKTCTIFCHRDLEQISIDQLECREPFPWDDTLMQFHKHMSSG